MCWVGVLLSLATPAPAHLETALEKLVGHQAAQAIAEEFGLENNPVLVEWVRQIGERVSTASPRTDVRYRFQIVQMNEPNAFALPGGYLFVTKGLLEFVNDDDELAALLAHEVGHVAARHAVQLARWQILAALFIAAVRSRAGEGAATAASLADALFMLGHSRRDELEADRLGAEFAARSGYDPNGLLAFLHKIGGTKQRSRLSRFFATHPTPEARIAHLKENPFVKAPPPEILISIGDRLASECRYNKALQKYEQVAQQRPDDAAIVARIADVHRAQGNEATAPSLPAVHKHPGPALLATTDGSRPLANDLAMFRQAAAAVLADLEERQRQMNHLLPKVQQSLRKTWARHQWTARLGAASLGAPQGLDYRWLYLATRALVLSQQIDQLLDGTWRTARLAPRTLQEALSLCNRLAQENPPDLAFPPDVLSRCISDVERAGQETLSSVAQAQKALPPLDTADRLVASVLSGLNSAYLVAWQMHWGHLAVLEGYLQAADGHVRSAEGYIRTGLKDATRARARVEQAAINRAMATATTPEQAIFKGLVRTRLGVSAGQVDEVLSHGLSLGEAVVALLFTRSTHQPHTLLAAAVGPSSSGIETAEKLGVPADVQAIVLSLLRRSIEEERLRP